MRNPHGTGTVLHGHWLPVALALLATLAASAPNAEARTYTGPQPRLHDSAHPQRATSLVVAPSGDPTVLMECLLGNGITVSNVHVVGAANATGGFTGGGESIGFDSGVVLSTGFIEILPGPNNFMSATGQHMTPGDADLNALLVDSGLGQYSTHDAAALEFDFQCTGTQQIDIDFVFASEEYDEFVGSVFNDVFAIFVDGHLRSNNIARTDGSCAGAPGLPIAVNTVNCGYLGLDPAAANCGCYISNADGNVGTEMDGLTRVFTARTTVVPGMHHMKIAIADTSDELLDSAVFLRCRSLTVPARRSTWGELKAHHR